MFRVLGFMVLGFDQMVKDPRPTRDASPLRRGQADRRQRIRVITAPPRHRGTPARSGLHSRGWVAFGRPMFYYNITYYYIILYYATLYYVISYDAMLSYVMLYIIVYRILFEHVGVDARERAIFCELSCFGISELREAQRMPHLLSF